MEAAIQTFIEHDAFAQSLGIEVEDASPGHAKVKLTLTDQHRNSFNTVHGGVIFSLADVAFAIAANAHGVLAMAINVNISFLKAITEGILYAEANEVSRNPKLATYTVTVTDATGALVATFQGMVYLKNEPAPGFSERATDER